jgi:hypothetical protein
MPEKPAETLTPEEDVEITETEKGIIEKLELPSIKIPKGKVANLLGLMNFIQSKFNSLKVKIEADEGKLTKEDYEKVKESLKQMGIDLD